MKVEGGVLVATWNMDDGGLPSGLGGVCASRKTLFSSQVIEETTKVSIQSIKGPANAYRDNYYQHLEV